MEKDKIYKFFADYILQHTGICYSADRYYQLDSRLEQLAVFFNVGCVEDVYQAFQSGVSAEAQRLVIDLATNNETFFFRDTVPFDALTQKLLPEIATRNEASRSIRIWSAGCSTGQEPYSIVMAILEKLPQLASWKLKIDASDVSERALTRAREGKYSSLEAQRGICPHLLKKYFTHSAEGSWTVMSHLKAVVEFFPFNLITGSYPPLIYDVIFCRNVLIYQTPDSKRKIVSKLFDCLKPGGFLIMGGGETLLMVNDQFVPRYDVGGFTFQKPLLDPKSNPQQLQKKSA